MTATVGAGLDRVRSRAVAFDADRLQAALKLAEVPARELLAVPLVADVVRRLSEAVRVGASVVARRSILSVASESSVLSVASVLSIGSAGSALSLFSAGSVLSVWSAGSILSVGSAGSLLSFGSAGSILCWRCDGAILNRRTQWAPVRPLAQDQTA